MNDSIFRGIVKRFVTTNALWKLVQSGGRIRHERKLDKTTKLFPYRSFKLTMPFRTLFHFIVSP